MSRTIADLFTYEERSLLDYYYQFYRDMFLPQESNRGVICLLYMCLGKRVDSGVICEATPYRYSLILYAYKNKKEFRSWIDCNYNIPLFLQEVVYTPFHHSAKGYIYDVQSMTEARIYWLTNCDDLNKPLYRIRTVVFKAWLHQIKCEHKYTNSFHELHFMRYCYPAVYKTTCQKSMFGKMRAKNVRLPQNFSSVPLRGYNYQEIRTKIKYWREVVYKFGGHYIFDKMVVLWTKIVGIDPSALVTDTELFLLMLALGYEPVIYPGFGFVVQGTKIYSTLLLACINNLCYMSQNFVSVYGINLIRLFMREDIMKWMSTEDLHAQYFLSFFV